MIFKLLAKFFDESDGRHGSGVAERTESAAQHVFRKVLDVVDVAGRAKAGVETRERFFEPVGAFAAGNTPAAALVRIKTDGAEGEFDDAGLVVDDDNATRAEHGTGFAHLVEVHTEVFDFLGQ
jgi:hypothetical protein